jgi:hypothetical protein
MKYRTVGGELTLALDGSHIIQKVLVQTMIQDIVSLPEVENRAFANIHAPSLILLYTVSLTMPCPR